MGRGGGGGGGGRRVYGRGEGGKEGIGRGEEGMGGGIPPPPLYEIPMVTPYTHAQQGLRGWVCPI